MNYHTKINLGMGRDILEKAKRISQLVSEYEIIKNLMLLPCLFVVYVLILVSVIITNKVIEHVKMERSKLFEINKVLIDVINRLIETGK